MRSFCTTAAILAASVVLAAQPPQGPRPGGGPGGGTPPDPQQMIQFRVERLSDILGLTDSQKTQAITIFTEAANASQAVQPKTREARQALQEAVKNGNLGGLENAARTIGELTAQMTVIEAKAEIQLRSILTPEQVAKLPPGGGFGGPGGPGGPGGFGQMRRGGPPQR